MLEVALRGDCKKSLIVPFSFITRIIERESGGGGGGGRGYFKP